jgi:hypothetical protein
LKAINSRSIIERPINHRDIATTLPESTSFRFTFSFTPSGSSPFRRSTMKQAPSAPRDSELINAATSTRIQRTFGNTWRERIGVVRGFRIQTGILDGKAVICEWRIWAAWPSRTRTY